MEETKKCPACAEEIKKKAKKCPKCQKDLRNWFIKHWILGIVLGLLFLWIIWNSLWESNSWNSTSKESVKSKNTTSTKTEVEKIKIRLTKDLCKSIKTWDTKETVISKLWEPKSISESEIDWIWLTEYLIYQIGWAFDMETCQISVSSWKVTIASYTKL